MSCDYEGDVSKRKEVYDYSDASCATASSCVVFTGDYALISRKQIIGRQRGRKHDKRLLLVRR